MVCNNGILTMVKFKAIVEFKHEKCEFCFDRSRKVLIDSAWDVNKCDFFQVS